MKQYKFRALITLDPAPREGSAGSQLGGTRTCCLVQPGYHEYFPARISWDKELPVRPGVRAVVSVTLADGEAQTFFAPGQRFTIWADAVIGQTVRADGMAGHGVISSPVSPPSPRAHDARAPRTPHGHRLAAVGVPAAHDRGQPLAV